MKNLKNAFKIIVILLVVYFTFSAIAWNVNPSDWNGFGRGLWALFSGIIIIVAILNSIKGVF